MMGGQSQLDGMDMMAAAGTAVRFGPGRERHVTLAPLTGKRAVHHFNQTVMGAS